MTQSKEKQSQVYPAQFVAFEPDGEVQSFSTIGLVLDIPLCISVELGRADTTVKQVLELGPGSIMELDKTVGQPVDMLVNNRLFARGEVVVVDENFAIRISNIVSPLSRGGALDDLASERPEKAPEGEQTKGEPEEEG